MREILSSLDGRRTFLVGGAASVATTLLWPSFASANGVTSPSDTYARLPCDALAPVEPKPKIIVIGVGGEGARTIQAMISSGMQGVEFVVADTDAHVIGGAQAAHFVPLGVAVGNMVASRTAISSRSVRELQALVDGADIAVITARMDGGAEIRLALSIAKLARDTGVFTIGAVTTSADRNRHYRLLVPNLCVESFDSTIIMPVWPHMRPPCLHGCSMEAEELLLHGVRTITDLIVVPGMIALDSEDIRSVLGGAAMAATATGEAEGGNRAIKAAEAAIEILRSFGSPLSEASALLLRVSGGTDMTLYEVDAAASRIRDEVDTDIDIVFGTTFVEKLGGRMSVSVVAAGICPHV